MKQISFSDAEFSAKSRVTRRERFLDAMSRSVPFERLEALIAPHYPRHGQVGRPPKGVALMLRVYFLQQWFGLSDEGLEDAIYDSQAMRAFLGIELTAHGVPDATTLLKFRGLLETHGLTEAIFAEVNAHLSEQGLLLRAGTLIDATLIEAPSSTKNRDKARDPEMHQSKKGNQWHFGLKAHIGVDADTGLVHSMHTTAGNGSDMANAVHCLHGQEQHVHADAGYTGAAKRPEIVEAAARGEIRADVTWHIAEKRGLIQAMTEGEEKDKRRAFERAKAQIRAFVEHPFHVLKNLFGYTKARYRGLAKNDAQLKTLFALANVVLAGRARATACPYCVLSGISPPENRGNDAKEALKRRQ